MAILTLDDLFARLVEARKDSEIEIILKELGDQASHGLHKTFGSLLCAWEPYGDSESNESTIGLASKPGRSLTERITNAIDAILELSCTKSSNPPPNSPGKAAEEWYGRAQSGPQSGLYKNDQKEGNLSRLINVVLSDSGLNGAPTIDTLDAGIGLRADDMPTTILSLQKGNKIKKPYLMGRFGQGGSSTLAFCKYAVIVSRAESHPSEIGFTIVRLVDPGEDYELDVHAYLTVSGKIPRVSNSSNISFYPDTKLKRSPDFQYGTFVRHVGFQLPGLDKRLSPATGNLYHYLHQSMFDPLLPFRVIDIREGAPPRDERIGGSRNRLMNYVEKGKEENAGGRISVIHHHEMDDIIPLGGGSSSIGVEYWVVEAMRKPAKSKKGKKDKEEIILRSSSSELFVQRGYPIVATLNGQNHGELPAKFLKDLGLGVLSRHMVVHLDLSRTDRRVRRSLFSTTRESFKEGQQLEELKKTLGEIIKDDQRLTEIEQEFTDRMVSRDHRATSDRVKTQIAKLLRDAGFERTESGENEDAGDDEEGGAGSGDGGGGGGGTSEGGRRTEPLPTLPFPDVTRWEIVSPSQARVRLNGHAAVRIETDADEQFDKADFISLEIEPGKVEVAAVSNLRGGRKQWRLRASEDAKIGDSGIVTAVLRTPNGGELRAAVQFEIMQPIEGRKGKRARIPNFEVLPISPDNESQSEMWAQLWPQMEGTSRVKKSEVAFKVFTSTDKTIVYYSTAFGPYVKFIEKLKSQSTALATLFEENYQIWVGYHAILQLPEDQKAEDVELEILEQERCRVASVQLRVAVELARLQRKLGALDEDD